MPRLSQLREERIKKLAKVREAGIDPFPANVSRNRLVGSVLAKFEELESSQKQVSVAGRIRSIRVHGKAAFLDVEDMSGKLQFFMTQSDTQRFQFFLDILDEGDIIEAKGTAYLSKRNEKSLKVISLRLLTKSLRPLPKEWFGLKDTEERFRRRYLDLIFNCEVKDRFLKEAKILRELRAYLDSQHFHEVVTPVLQPLAGGALAKPFSTHFNALDIDVVLRIAPELYLKRLLVGGFEKIYELGPVFRNEGLDRDHNPEFLMLELYWAYQDWEKLMEFTEKWLSAVAQKVEFSLKPPPWQRAEFEKLFEEKIGVTYQESSEESLLAVAKEKGVIVNRRLSKAKIADELFKKLVRPLLEEPTFITKLPIEISPFAKRLSHDSARTARFVLYINGLELVNGFSELNDPSDQEERFLAQQEMKKAGDEEVTEYDKDFIEALEYGMPPAAGLGLGVTRFLMLLTSAPNVREATLFPLMKPKNPTAE